MTQVKGIYGSGTESRKKKKDEEKEPGVKEK